MTSGQRCGSGTPVISGDHHLRHGNSLPSVARTNGRLLMVVSARASSCNFPRTVGIAKSFDRTPTFTIRKGNKGTVRRDISRLLANLDYGHRTVAFFAHGGPVAFWYVRLRVQGEVEFGNARAYYQDDVKFTLAAHYKTAEFGVLIVPTEQFARSLCKVGRQRALAKGRRSYTVG
jgi:hypothetical protein